VWGSCVTIAVIKAAFTQFKSVPDIYLAYQFTNDTIFITFNDGVKIALSKQEIDTARSLAAFNCINSFHTKTSIPINCVLLIKILKSITIKREFKQNGRFKSDSCQVILANYKRNP